MKYKSVLILLVLLSILLDPLPSMANENEDRQIDINNIEIYQNY